MSALPPKADMCSARAHVCYGPKADTTVTAFRLAAEAIKCVVRTCRHIKTSWCSPWRIANFRMATAWNGHAADDGASNLLLWSGGSLRVALVLGRRASWNHRNCKHNGRNNGRDCFHCGPSFRSFSRSRFSAMEACFRHCRAAIKSSRRSPGGICSARSSHFFALA
jgi:hypothetical protein